jgi:hypothetical protein
MWRGWQEAQGSQFSALTAAEVISFPTAPLIPQRPVCSLNSVVVTLPKLSWEGKNLQILLSPKYTITWSLRPYGKNVGFSYLVWSTNQWSLSCLIHTHILTRVYAHMCMHSSHKYAHTYSHYRKRKSCRTFARNPNALFERILLWEWGQLTGKNCPWGTSVIDRSKSCISARRLRNTGILATYFWRGVAVPGDSLVWH